MNGCGLPPLYLIADRATCAGRPIETVLKAAVDGGVRLIQLREKTMDPGDRLRLAVRARAVTSDPDVRLLINSDVSAAHSVGADGVHLPGDRIGDTLSARERLGVGAIVGASVHNEQELARAEEAGVDFVVFSPVFEPGSKPYAVTPVGVDGLRKIAEATDLPVYALGGITPERTAACCEAGAHGVAVMSGILKADDPEQAAGRYLEALQ